jgi:hypothetical protein
MGHHQDHVVQAQGMADVDGRHQVSDVGRVEGSSEQTDPRWHGGRV